VTGLSTSLKLIWLASGILQFAILVLLVVRRHYRTLPMFAWYIGLNLAQAIIMVGIYSHFGFYSAPSFRTYWATEVIIMVAQTLASTELLHRALQGYPGIWQLTWRVIFSAIIVVTIRAWATANSTDQWGLWSAHIGYYLTFAIAFVFCLLLIRRYSILIDPVYKMLVGGFCFYSCGSIIADALMKSQYLKRFPAYAEVWNYSELWVFVITLVVWIVALRHPVRASSQAPSTPSGGAYEEIGPQVNARLRELNETLRKFFRKHVVES
jgi:hypothetical protein